MFAVVQFPGFERRPRHALRAEGACSAPKRAWSGTRTPSCPPDTARRARCPAASPTATTCAAARWRASRRSWPRAALRRRGRAGARHLQRLPGALRGGAPARARSCATATSHFVCELRARARRARRARRSRRAPRPGQRAAAPDQARRGRLHARARASSPRSRPNGQVVLRYCDARGRASPGREPERRAREHRRRLQRRAAT